MFELFLNFRTAEEDGETLTIVNELTVSRVNKLHEWLDLQENRDEILIKSSRYRKIGLEEMAQKQREFDIKKYRTSIQNLQLWIAIAITLYIFQQAYAYSKVASNCQEAIHNNRNEK